jgi:CDP-paratose 2-epimerase
VKCIKEGKKYRIFGFNGEQVRDQMHAYDLVNAMWHFIQNPKISAVYNMGGGKERAKTLKEFAEIISKKVGKPFLSKYLKENRWADRKYDVHDISKFRKDYPEWDYKYSLSDIIKDLCQTF